MKKNFLGPNMYQSKSGVKNFSLHWWGGGGGVQKVTSKHTYIHTYRHHSDQISRSARETERLKIVAKSRWKTSVEDYLMKLMLDNLGTVGVVAGSWHIPPETT